MDVVDVDGGTDQIADEDGVDARTDGTPMVVTFIWQESLVPAVLVKSWKVSSLIDPLQGIGSSIFSSTIGTLIPAVLDR